MRRTFLKSKIHRAVVTGADLTYEGSISIDPRLCEAADLLPFERVEVYNCANGTRIATYVIHGGEGEICLNGAAARHAHPGDRVIICSYAELEESEIAAHRPKLVFVDDANRPTRKGDRHLFSPADGAVEAPATEKVPVPFSRSASGSGRRRR